jgi:hypothetical protein
MFDNIIHFESLDWENPKEGVEQKVYSKGKKKMRLLVFQDTFIEEGWCLNGHVGFVLDGEMNVDFSGSIRKYKKGDGIWIDEGKSSKHKVVIEKGKHVELVLFESMK